ncbi:class I SAM-dependent methyltransferase [Aestuariicella sp. G3-2]|uniref:class I SAM-dependent methyltransferase n=1 Tax=Pseudomaricurvus albidus TaxID=2842452 RepID=UPI001C0BF03C|nr:class I SAM-dependent methyltransferase [Aestuariicella albida]MBU3071657.1 class I SAM-dependent methyltransferase [Aestuariicella albida]
MNDYDLKKYLEEIKTGIVSLEQRISRLENTSERVEDVASSIINRENEIFEFVESQINGRTLTLEWVTNKIDFEVVNLHKMVESLYIQKEVNDSSFLNCLKALPKYQFICEKVIADDSMDHVSPESTYEGVVSKPLFVKACERVLEKTKLNFLDLGCGAGSIVMDFLKRGHFAVGIDGSDSCLKADVGYWNYIDFLHTCDTSKPFKFYDVNGKQIKFDVISMWEVFEHIPEELCGQVVREIVHNLSDEGFFVGSISKLEYVNSESGKPYHVTLKPKSWWDKLFEENGLKVMNSPFAHEEYCRGVGGSYQDVHNYLKSPETGFHIFAVKR